MSYRDAKDGIAKHRSQQIAALLGEAVSKWFTSQWSSIQDMLAAFSSDDENAAIASGYATAPGAERAGAHIRLDYVCAMRREVRKQYVSEDSGICTDVTPFRHGVISAHGAALFDDLMETVVRHAERQAEGGKQ